jgi:hypothetical protein
VTAGVACCHGPRCYGRAVVVRSASPLLTLAVAVLQMAVGTGVGCRPTKSSPLSPAVSSSSQLPESVSRPVNRLAGEKSPYLLQHRHNPVDWYPWGPEAFEKAKREGKPIFLSIGYSTCHWCHVMERESCEDRATAAVLNDHFVSIKVDREERPDVDKIYMTYVQARTGSGGWPLNVFLTPDRQPFYGGTYCHPRDARGGRDLWMC